MIILLFTPIDDNHNYPSIVDYYYWLKVLTLLIWTKQSKFNKNNHKFLRQQMKDVLIELLSKHQSSPIQILFTRKECLNKRIPIFPETFYIYPPQLLFGFYKFWKSRIFYILNSIFNAKPNRRKNLPTVFHMCPCCVTHKKKFM